MSGVLVTNGLQSKSLAVVRSLGSRGIRVVTSEKTRFHASGFSKFAAKNAVYPDPAKSAANYLDWLTETIRKERIDVLFPMDDDTLSIAVAHRHEIAKLVRFAAPSPECFIVASDKGSTMKLAQERGVPCPRTVQLSGDMPHEEDEYMDAAADLEFPVVLKPRHSAGSRGIRFVKDRGDLIGALRTIMGDYPNPIIQEWVAPGPKYDVCLCYNSNHELTASFVQKEIRNYPIQSGPSTVCESVFHPELVSLSDRLMQGIPWVGVADVEYMADGRTGEPKLMEINPRFWSSLHTAVRSGVDFPWILYRLAMDQEVEPVFEYVEGIRGRSLLPGDILHFLSNPDRFRMDPPFWSKLPDDILNARDPMPAAGFLFSALRYSLDPGAWKFLFRR